MASAPDGDNTALGIIYVDPPEDDSHRNPDPEIAIEELTASQLNSMKLIGKPVYIEHETKDENGNCCKVGTVTAQFKTDDKKYGVKIRYDDSDWGRRAKLMVDSGKLKALSLSHTVNMQTGRVIPREVSLCILGKRVGTEIIKDANGSLNMMTFKCSGSNAKARSLLFDEFNNLSNVDGSHGTSSKLAVHDGKKKTNIDNATSEEGNVNGANFTGRIMSEKSLGAKDENVRLDNKSDDKETRGTDNDNNARTSTIPPKNLSSGDSNSKTAPQSKINEELEMSLLPSTSHKGALNKRVEKSISEDSSNRETVANSGSGSNAQIKESPDLKSLISRENRNIDVPLKLSASPDSRNSTNTLLDNICNLERELSKKEEELMRNRMIIMEKREKLARVRKLAENDTTTAKSQRDNNSLSSDIRGLKDAILDIKKMLRGNASGGENTSSDLKPPNDDTVSVDENQVKTHAKDAQGDVGQANLEEYKEANLQGGNKMSNFQENTNTSGEMNPDNVNSRSIQGKVSEGVTSTKSNRDNEGATKRSPDGNRSSEFEGNNDDHAQGSLYQAAGDETGMRLAILARNLEDMDIPPEQKEALIGHLSDVSDAVSKNNEELNNINRRLNEAILGNTRDMLNSYASNAKVSGRGGVNLFNEIVKRGLKHTPLKYKQDLLQFMTNSGRNEKRKQPNASGTSKSLEVYKKKYAKHEKNWQPTKRKFVTVKASDRFNNKKRKINALERAYEEYIKDTIAVDKVNKLVTFG